MVTSLRRREETASTNLAGSAARIERCEAASQSVRQQPAVAPCVSSRQHVPKSTSCCSACTSSRSTSAPVLMAPEHQPVVHHEGLAGPGGWVAAAPELPIAVLGAARRQLDVPRSADIIYKVCPDVPSGPVRSESCWNSSQGTPGVCPDVCPEKSRLRRECARRGGVPSGPIWRYTATVHKYAVLYRTLNS